MQHSRLAAGGWNSLSFAEQMGNIGSEVNRSIQWRKKSKRELAWKAFVRSTELLWLSVDSAKQEPGKLKELTRMRECWFDFFVFDNQYHSTAESFIKYFDAFAFLAQKRKGL